jgi:putative ABC transport system ATP-binding protein
MTKMVGLSDGGAMLSAVLAFRGGICITSRHIANRQTDVSHFTATRFVFRMTQSPDTSATSVESTAATAATPAPESTAQAATPAPESTAQAAAASALLIQQLDKVVRTGSEPLAILQGVDIDIKCGESVAIVGASGSGKSTLLGLMAGLDQPTRGEITLLGERIDRLSEDQRAAVRARGVSFVFQNFQLLPGLTALENVMLPLEIRAQAQAREQARQLLAQVGLSQREQHYPSQLSGGEQQRVAIARAFAGSPQILFADEPTGNLDRTTGHQVEELLFRLNAENGTTLVLVTHDPQLAARCQRQVEMQDGRLQPVAKDNDGGQQ